MRILFLGLFMLASACVVKEATATPGSASPTNPEKTVISPTNIDDLTSVQELKFNEPLAVKWTLDSSAYWVHGLHSATLFDSSTQQEIASYTVGEDSYLFDVSPDGRLLAYSTSDPNIILFDVLDQHEVSQIALETITRQASFSPDGSMIGAPSMDVWAVTLWDVKSSREIKVLTGFETAAPVYSFQFGADGKTVLWIARATIQPSDIDSDQMGPRIGLEDFISSAALSPDGNLLATTSAGTVDDEFMPIVTVWDAHTGENLAMFSNTADDYFTSINFSSDGNLLAAGSTGKVRFWNISDFQPAGEISIAADYVSSLQFSPDGTRLLTCSSQGSVQLWQISN